MTKTESESQTANIQIVDDNPQNLAILTALLAGQGYEVRTAISGSLALKSAQKREPDLILLDLRMPDLDGYQVCERLKADERTCDVPVIFVSAAGDLLDKVRAFSAGAVDYITDPFQEQEVLERVETHLALRRAQKSLEKTNALPQELAHDLGERVKELNCLYGISKLVETPKISLEGILQGAADLIPSGWHYPEITCARIRLDGQVFSTRNYQETPWLLAADILVHGERCGRVQVGYLEERPEIDEGPFLKEERNLIDAIARRLGRIAERDRAEQQVRQQHHFLQNVLDSLTHPFYVINARDRTVALANRVAYAGILPGQITCYALMHGRDRPCDTQHPCPLQEVRRTKEPVIVEHVHIDAEGRRRDVEVYGFPILDRGGNLVQMIEYAQDITERKQAEERLRQNDASLATLEERERIGRELHDDLAQVIGYLNVQAQAAMARLEQGRGAQAQAILAQLVQTAQDANADLRQHILGIRASGIPGIRASGIPGDGQPSAQGVDDFLTTLSQYLDTIRERYGLEIQASWPEGLADSPLAPEIETRLLRIIQEALTNVGLHAGVDTARLLFTLHGDKIQAVIADDGRGFEAALEPANSESRGLKDPETSATDHESRVTDHAARISYHFGLAIMRERAESVDGSLEVRSAPGKGTRVIVRLPLLLVPPAEEEQARGIRVLLVDDHLLYLEGLRTLLSARGMQVVGLAHDGLEALEQARALHPDLILMDVRMPGSDGVEATRRIKAELPEIRVVMLTTAAEQDTLFEALRAGASGYLLKSLAGRQFFNLLSRVLAGETVLSPSLAGRVLAEFARQEAAPASEEEDAPVLTSRQREVMELVAQGQTNKEIARALYVSEATVKYHVSQVLERLHLQSRHQIAEYAQAGRLAPSLDN